MADEYSAEQAAMAEQEIAALRFEVDVLKVAIPRLIALLVRRGALDMDDVESAADSTEEILGPNAEITGDLVQMRETVRELFGLRL